MRYIFSGYLLVSAFASMVRYLTLLVMPCSKQDLDILRPTTPHCIYVFLQLDCTSWMAPRQREDYFPIKTCCSIIGSAALPSSRPDSSHSGALEQHTHTMHRKVFNTNIQASLTETRIRENCFDIRARPRVSVHVPPRLCIAKAAIFRLLRNLAVLSCCLGITWHRSEPERRPASSLKVTVPTARVRS